MRLGILTTGRVNEALVGTFGEYDGTFAAIYQAADPAIEVRSWAVLDGEFPDNVHAADAWLITGSKHGVYDDLPWIGQLKVFLQDARAGGVPMIGICFGHQLMAEAFGGSAVKSDKGWGVGVHDYSIAHAAPWMAGAGTGFRMHAFHQDQIVALPADAHVLASSPFCEAAMVSYGDPALPEAISVQPHPEFTGEYARALLDLRSGIAIPAETAEVALGTVADPHDGTDFVRWSLAYINEAMARRRAA